ALGGCYGSTGYWTAGLGLWSWFRFWSMLRFHIAWIDRAIGLLMDRLLFCAWLRDAVGSLGRLLGVALGSMKGMFSWRANVSWADRWCCWGCFLEEDGFFSFLGCACAFVVDTTLGLGWFF
ncbi:hypothetical protein U1Q18_038897, partial [Sarracenia purpurea var. burkii]